MSKNYKKGVRLERVVVNQAKKRGFIAFRSAGSHSPIDVCIINSKERKISFIQYKTGKLSQKEKKRILELLNALTNEYMVDFRLEHKP